MKKLCINNRDEMVMLFLDNIACLLADGNYTKICYLQGMQTTLSIGLSKIEKMIAGSYANGKVCPFMRLGRSTIINQMYLYDINLAKQTMILSDCGKSQLTLRLPKALLKSYKEMVSKANKPRETK